MRKTLIFGLFFLISIPLAGSAEDTKDSLEPGSFSIGGMLRLDGYYHKLSDNWSVTEVGGGINKNYTYSSSTPSVNDGATVFGESLFLNVGFRPIENLRGSLDFEIIGGYADKYWMPVNLEHRMDLAGQRINFNRGEIIYSPDWMELRYFRNIGHSSWEGNGDLFNLFPAQYESDRYLRVSGRSVPEGYELKLEGKAGKLDLIYGPEVIWDYRDGYYANYNFHLLGLNSNLIYRNHIIPYGEPDERMSSGELSTDIGISEHSLKLAVMYQPFRLNREYAYVDYVNQGEGYFGSRFDKKTGTTGQSDAFGYSAKLTLNKLPAAKELTIKLSHLGLVAGNKNEIDTLLTERITRSLTGCFEYTYRKPLLGPLPLATEGTQAVPGPALIEPRDMTSPFWVSWNNETTGWDNREASLMSFIFTFDPTPDTWFYNFEPNKVEEWNINPKENAPLSLAAKYTLSRYFTATDRLVYWDQNGHMVWEGPLLYEPWPTDGYIGDFTLLARIQTGKALVIFNLGGGESLAGNGFAYTDSTAREKPITAYFTSGVSFEQKPYTVKLRYSQDNWGPEEWHQRYGQTFDRLYQAHLSRKFGENISAGIEYVGGREIDKKYYAAELGDYDEFHLFLSVSFGPMILFTGKAPELEPQIGQPPVPAEIPVPKVTLDVPLKTFSPLEGKELELRAWAADISGIDSWKIEISGLDGKIIKTISGEGRPPFSLKWDGKDDTYRLPVQTGSYSAIFSAKNGDGVTGQTNPVDFSVTGSSKAAVNEVSIEVKIKETERGLLVSMTSKVLFDSGKSVLKGEAGKALDEVVRILNAYKANKIAVEGHTDGTGDAAVNQRLSEQRARNVADYLVKSGIAENRIIIAGFGKSKPVADNSTAAGREANRRVEVIILKQ